MGHLISSTTDVSLLRVQDDEEKMLDIGGNFIIPILQKNIHQDVSFVKFYEKQIYSESKQNTR